MSSVCWICFSLFLLVVTALAFLTMGLSLFLYWERYRFSHLAGPPLANFWLGHVQDIAAYRKQGRTFYDYFLDQAIAYGDVFVVFVCHKPIVSIADPFLIRKLFIHHHLIVPKDLKVYHKLGFVCGQRIAGYGLVTNTDEESWKTRRRCLNLAFQRGKSRIGKKFIAAFNYSSRNLLERLETRENAERKEICMLEEFTRTSLQASDQAICGRDSKLTDKNLSEILTAFEKCLEGVQANLSNVLPLSWTRVLTKKTPRQLEYIKAAQTVRNFAKEVIEEREKRLHQNGHDVPNDILAYILNITKEDPTFTLEDKIDEVVTFFVAAHETTAGCLAFTLFEILSSKRIHERVVNEVDVVLGSKEILSERDLRKLHFLHNCLKESLRLYPVVGGPDRTLVKDLIIDDYFLPKGCSVFAEKYVMHRHPKYWKNPQVFNPHRFNERQSTTIQPGVYFPFSVGPRSCIGKVFAEMQIKMVLARLFQKFHLELVPGQTRQIKERLTLRPKDGVMCTIKRRTIPTRKERAMTQ